MCTLIALVALGLVVAGCAVAATPPSLPELEGVWGGRMFGPSGNAAASLTLKAGGTYTGTMFLDAGDRSVHGRIVTTPSGQLRYVSTEGAKAG